MAWREIRRSRRLAAAIAGDGTHHRLDTLCGGRKLGNDGAQGHTMDGADGGGGAQSDTILIVSHGNAMTAMVHWWLRLHEAYFSRVSYDFDCCSITELTMNRWGERQSPG